MEARGFYGWPSAPRSGSGTEVEDSQGDSGDEVVFIEVYEFDDEAVAEAVPATSARVPSLSRPASSSRYGPGPMTTPTQQLATRPHPGTPTSASSRQQLEVVLDATPRQQPSLSYPQPARLVTSDVDPAFRNRNRVMSSSLPTAGVGSPSRASVPSLTTPTASQNTATAPRKRGRPKGWKPGMSYAAKDLPPEEASARRQRLLDKPPPNYVLKKRRPGRPPKNPSLSPVALFHSLDPKYIPFLCEWKGCKAELQNMATLRKHVMVVHRRSEVCHWGKCADLTPPVELDSDDAFEAHMEKSHLVPCEWHMGDGFRNTNRPIHESKTPALPRWLFDSQGNQVTPSIKGQEIEDRETWLKNRRRLKQVLHDRDANAPFEEELYPEEEE